MNERPRASSKLLGALAVACWAVHAVASLQVGRPLNLLWACNLGALVIGAGLLLEWGALASVGVLWLCLGIPLWLLDAFQGGDFMVSSIFPHIGGFALGVAGLARLGLPAGSWRRAAAGLFILQQVCRWTTPARENVNVCAGIWPGWEKLIPSYLVFWALLFALSVAVFAASERGLRRFVPPA